MGDRDLVTGIVAAALGVLAVSIAALEYYVSTEMTTPAHASAAGGSDLTLASAAYILAYLGAGSILLALGLFEIYRSRRRPRARR